MFNDAVILVTGGTGSFGNVCFTDFKKLQTQKIIVFHG